MGASVIRDPRYQALAATAAGGLGAGPNVQRAILAQFACEKAGEWPPNDNNPGNVHVGPMAQVGQVLPRGRGDSGQVALFPTPDAGAWGYAAYIGKHPLYVDARRDIGRDDGEAYIRDVLKRGYGTNLSCTMGYYRALGGAATPTPDPGTGGRPPIVTGGGTGVPFDLGNPAKGTLGGGIDGPKLAQLLGRQPTDRLNRADIDKLATGWAASGAPDPAGTATAIFRDRLHNGLDRYIGQQFSTIPDVTADVQGAASAAGIVSTAILGTPAGAAIGGAGTVAAAAGDAAAAAIGAVIPLVVGGLVLIVAAVLILGGGKDALSG